MSNAKPTPCKGCVYLRERVLIFMRTQEIIMGSTCVHPACDVIGTGEEYAPKATDMRIHGPCGWEAKLRETGEHAMPCPCGGGTRIVEHDAALFSVQCERCEKHGAGWASRRWAVADWNRSVKASAPRSGGVGGT